MTTLLHCPASLLQGACEAQDDADGALSESRLEQEGH